jgi:toxin HigB-1
MHHVIAEPMNGEVPLQVIKSFLCKDTEALFADRRVPRFRDIERSARRKLLYLNQARNLQDLRVPPGNRLEALSGNREGQFSIRINDQWRLCFKWDDGDVHDVEIVDYH